MTWRRARGLLVAWLMFDALTLPILFTGLSVSRLVALLLLNGCASFAAAPLLQRISKVPTLGGNRREAPDRDE